MFRNIQSCLLFLVLCSIPLSIGKTLYEGDACLQKNPYGSRNGMCLIAYKCSWALQQIYMRNKICTCNFEGITPIVCCPLNQITEQDVPNAMSSQRPRNNITDASESPMQQNKEENLGLLSAIKCNEYYPLQYTVGAGGTLAEEKEFPHMAALGYGETNEKQWLCGGSLISLRHVLTAAHCIYSTASGNVKYVRLGDLNLASKTDKTEPQNFNVKTATAHPDYDSATFKNDIAIIELDRSVNLTKYVKPACLYVWDTIDTQYSITSCGWGVTEFAGNPSDHLIKVSLKIIDNSECQRQYVNAGSRGLIDDDSQVCAGSADDKKIMDTCEGDSGGPLQILTYTFPRPKHYHIIGVTSFGKACGISKSAGVYTRVRFHIPWIESLVFKN